jgi:hypothetical protein
MKSNRDAMEMLEGRQLMAASSITITGQDLQGVNNSDGTRANADDVVVHLSGQVKTSVDLTKIRFFGYAADNTSTTGEQIKKTIPIASASVKKTTAGYDLVLRTRMLVRKGANLTISAGAVKDNSNNDVTGVLDLRKGVARPAFTLAGRAFNVRDKTLYGNDVLTGGSTPTTANTEPSENSVKDALEAFLDKKVRQKVITQATEDATLTRFSSSAVKAICSSPNLRAAIFSLVGTVGEPAIGFYFDAKNSTGKAPVALRFDGSEFDPGAKIVASTFNGQGRLKVIFSPNYAGESFAVLSGILAHETLHDGRNGPGSTQVDSQTEEVIANYVESEIWGQQLIADSSFASAHTVLSTRANYRLMLALNSGKKAFPSVGLEAAPLLTGTNAAIGFDTSDSYGDEGGTSVRSFEEDVRREFTDRNVLDKTAEYQKTESVGRAILTNITGKTYTSSTLFNQALMDDLDKSQRPLTQLNVLKLAKTLSLRI